MVTRILDRLLIWLAASQRIACLQRYPRLPRSLDIPSYAINKNLYVVEQFVEGRDVFVSLSTGSGKSLCYMYFILPRVYDILKGITSTESQSVAVVVSPLIALMKDQV